MHRFALCAGAAALLFAFAIPHASAQNRVGTGDTRSESICPEVPQIKHRLALAGDKSGTNYEYFVMPDAGCRIKDLSKIYTVAIQSDDDGEFRVQAGPARRHYSGMFMYTTAPYRSVAYQERLAMYLKESEGRLAIIATIFHKDPGSWSSDSRMWFAYTFSDNVREQTSPVDG